MKPMPISVSFEAGDDVEYTAGNWGLFEANLRPRFVPKFGAGSTMEAVNLYSFESEETNSSEL